MSGSDALLWTISADPVMRPTIVAIMVLDGRPDWAEVRARIGALTVGRATPALPSREPRPRDAAARSSCPTLSFELDTHLRRMRLAGHGNLRDVLDMAQTMATSGFDAALPLWEAVLVEGVADRAALVMKVHHALIDGVGGLAVLAHLFDPLGSGAAGDAWRRDAAGGSRAGPGATPAPPLPARSDRARHRRRRTR